MVDMWSTWKRLAYLNISNGLILDSLLPYIQQTFSISMNNIFPKNIRWCLKWKCFPVQQTSWSPPYLCVFSQRHCFALLLDVLYPGCQSTLPPPPSPPLELVNPGGLNKHAGFKCSAQTLPPLPLLSVGKFQRKFYFLPSFHCPLSGASERNRLKRPTQGSNTDSSSCGPPVWRKIQQTIELFFIHYHPHKVCVRQWQHSRIRYRASSWDGLPGCWLCHSHSWKSFHKGHTRRSRHSLPWWKTATPCCVSCLF